MANDAMNKLIADRYHARRGPGVVGRVAGARLDDERQRAFQEALSATERAHKAGDPIVIQQAEEKLDAVLDEVRAAHQPAEPPQEPAVSFDGGVRRPVRPYEPANMNRHIAGAIRERRALAQAARGD